MNHVGQIERLTQNRIVKLFKDNLNYSYLGNWEERIDNSNVEEHLLFNYLTKNAGYPEDLARRAINEIKFLTTTGRRLLKSCKGRDNPNIKD